jgi:hypothetical protein
MRLMVTAKEWAGVSRRIDRQRVQQRTGYLSAQHSSSLVLPATSPADLAHIAQRSCCVWQTLTCDFIATYQWHAVPVMQFPSLLRSAISLVVPCGVRGVSGQSFASRIAHELLPWNRKVFTWCGSSPSSQLGAQQKLPWNPIWEVGLREVSAGLGCDGVGSCRRSCPFLGKSQTMMRATGDGTSC